MTKSEQPDLKPVIAAIYAELAALWKFAGCLNRHNFPDVPPDSDADKLDAWNAECELDYHVRMDLETQRRASACAAISLVFGPEREITHDELLAMYKQWGGE